MRIQLAVLNNGSIIEWYKLERTSGAHLVQCLALLRALMTPTVLSLRPTNHLFSMLFEFL